MQKEAGYGPYFQALTFTILSHEVTRLKKEKLTSFEASRIMHFKKVILQKLLIHRANIIDHIENRLFQRDQLRMKICPNGKSLKIEKATNYLGYDYLT